MKKSLAFSFQSWTLLCYPLFLTIILFIFSAGSIYAQEADKLRDEYKFKLGITYEFSRIAKDQVKNSHEMNMWYSDAGFSGIEMNGKASMFMLYDMKSMKMITLMEAQKMAMMMDMKKMSGQIAGRVDSAKKEASDAKITKTGKTEKILGYSCEQYKITSKKTESLIWVTKELGAGFGDYSKSFGMLIGGKGGQGTGFPDMKGAADGVMLKMESTDTGTGDIIRMEATAVNKDGKNINTSGYKLMNMPGQ